MINISMIVDKEFEKVCREVLLEADGNPTEYGCLMCYVEDPVTNKFPKYHPHITLDYINKGS